VLVFLTGCTLIKGSKPVIKGEHGGLTMQKAVCLTLIVLMLTTCLPVLADTQVTEYQRGFRDGQREGRKDVGWVHVVWGFLTAGIHTLVVVFLPGKEVPYRKLILLEGEPQAYKYGFMDGYQDGYRRQRLSYSASGAATVWVLSIVGQAIPTD